VGLDRAYPCAQVAVRAGLGPADHAIDGTCQQLRERVAVMVFDVPGAALPAVDLAQVAVDLGHRSLRAVFAPLHAARQRIGPQLRPAQVEQADLGQQEADIALEQVAPVVIGGAVRIAEPEQLGVLAGKVQELRARTFVDPDPTRIERIGMPLVLAAAPAGAVHLPAPMARTLLPSKK
jgi:hypothetical protein